MIYVVAILVVLLGISLFVKGEKQTRTYKDLRKEFESVLLFSYEPEIVCQILVLENYVELVKKYETFSDQYTNRYGDIVNGKPYLKCTSKKMELNKDGMIKLCRLVQDEFVANYCCYLIENIAVSNYKYFDKAENTINNLKNYLISKTGKDFLLEDPLDDKFKHLRIVK